MSSPLEPIKRRNNDTALLKPAKAFRPINKHDYSGTYGNIASEIKLGLYDAVSAPYLLAKLCAAFEGLAINSCGQAAYKITWQTVIEHEETGHIVTFYDYKGGASFGSDVYGKDAPASFKADLIALIESFMSDRYPHPYDGCVVGELA